MKHVLILLVLFSIAATSCKKNNVRGKLKNRRDILESANWRLVKITDNGGPTSVLACQQDNYYVFTPGGSGRYEEGTDNCLDSTGLGNAPTYTPYRWQMTGDLREIYFLDWAGDPQDRFNWDVLDMNYEELTVRQYLTVDGINHRLDMVYRAMPK